MGGVARIGRIAGIPVYVHWSLVFIAALLGLGLSTSYLPAAAPDHSAGTYWLVGVAGTAFFFGSILAHELAHALVARRHGVTTDAIELWLLGGMARLRSEAPSPGADAQIAAAGPLVSVMLAVVGLGTAMGLAALDVPPLVVAMLGWLTLVNGVLAAFNLLPGAPLDGGRLLRAWRWHRHGDRLRATEEAARSGQVLGWAIVIVGVWLLFNGYGTFFLPITGLFLLTAARAELRGAGAEARLEGVQVKDAAWWGIAHAAGDTDAETMLSQRRRLGLSGVVAVERRDGTLAGLVAERQLWQVPEARRRQVRLEQLAVPMQRLGIAEPDEPLASALARVAPGMPALAVLQNGRLVGVVTPDGLSTRLGPRIGFDG